MLLDEGTLGALGALGAVSPGGAPRTPIQVYVIEEFSIDANVLLVVVLVSPWSPYRNSFTNQLKFFSISARLQESQWFLQRSVLLVLCRSVKRYIPDVAIR